MSNDQHDEVLERNVSTLIESGGEPPRIADLARARIKAKLLASAAPAAVRRRSPAIAVGIGLAVTAAAALIVTRFVGGEAPVARPSGALADGSTWIAAPGARVEVLGTRRVRVTGAALLDVTPGKGAFVVETARGTIEVLGTRFLVDGDATKTTAAVVRGSVKLSSGFGDPVTLHAGEQGVAEPGRPPTRGPAPRLTSLVSWARAARVRDEGKTVVPLRNGTLFAREPNNPHVPESPLPIVKLAVDVVVEDQVARVALDQTFHNPQATQLEGMYRFAIPPDASLQRLAMYVNGELQESAVVERMRARRIYEEIVYRRMDPALLEWAGTGRLALRVYPLPPREDKRLLLAYTQSLPRLYDDWTLSVPLPEVDLPVGELTFAVRMRGCANCEVTSPSHALAVKREGEDAIVTYSATGEKLGDSLVLRVRDGRKQAVVGKDGDFLLVRARPELGTAPRGYASEPPGEPVPLGYKPRTWVILDDVSASRGPMELRAQQDLIDSFMRELDEEDRVAVVAFDVDARVKLPVTRVLDVDRQALRRALAGEGGVGATSFTAALAEATKLLANVAPDDAMLVYLGDGVVTTGAKNLDALQAQIAGKLKFVGVGIGDGPDTQTLEALAGATGGYATTIDLADDLGWRAFDLVAALHTPRVTNLAAKLVDASGALVPATAYVKSPQLADGEELELVAKLAGSGTPATAVLTGTLDGKPWEQRVPLAVTSASARYLPRLWAQRHIAARMLAKHAAVVVPPCTATKTTPCPTEAELREQRDEAIRQEVVALGKQSFLLSRHTSLIVLENDAMYAQYKVAKGTGDTWARYEVPAKIPVVRSQAPIVPAHVASDAELVRTPLQVFYTSGLDDGLFQLEAQQPMRSRAGATRLSLGLALPDAQETEARYETANKGGDGWSRNAPLAEGKLGKWADKSGFAPKTVVTTGELMGGELARATGFGSGAGHMGLNYRFAGQLVAPQRYTYPTDTAFDDLTSLVPALFADASDAFRAQLQAAQAGTLDAGAKALLERARAALPVGVLRWGTTEYALDGERRFGWRRTTDADLAETASFDGKTWTRRYAELGLDATRQVAEDDIALAFGYLPLWIAAPAHYARWFDVALADKHTVTLSRDKRLAFALVFDDEARLVALRDGAGRELASIAWGATGPIAARKNGDAIDVGFTAQAIASAVAWAHGATDPGVTIELPGRLPAYWQAKAAALTAGTPAWRHAQRQYLVSLAATNDRATLFATYEALRTHGGVALGDLVLASGGIATGATDAAFATALAGQANPVARYLVAGRAYGKQPRPERLAPEIRTGMLGALWTLRESVALLQANKEVQAIDRLLALGARAFQLRLIGTAVATQRYTMKPADVTRAWDAVATGDYRNVARAQAALALANRGAYDAAADRIAALVADLDLRAAPPQLEQLQWQFQNSRRGQAGWQLVWATLRDRVLASDSFEHVTATLPLAAQHPIDLPAVLARAATLAKGDTERVILVAQLATQYNAAALAQQLVEPLVQAHPTRELLQLAGGMAQRQGRIAEALAYLEQAQAAGEDEAVNLATVRGELAQLLAVARQLAVQSQGAARTAAVDKAMLWTARWRAIDPGNAQIDQQAGELLLAVGDTAGAWRQLSTVIERDPMEGTGYQIVADAFERQGRVAEALAYWQDAIVIDQTNPTHRLRKAQALIALGRTAEGDALLAEIASRRWHERWASVGYLAKELLQRGKQAK